MDERERIAQHLERLAAAPGTSPELADWYREKAELIRTRLTAARSADEKFARDLEDAIAEIDEAVFKPPNSQSVMALLRQAAAAVRAGGAAHRTEQTVLLLALAWFMFRK